MEILELVIKNEKRGIKDEWQLFDSGQLEEVGNDTRFIYTSRFDTVRQWNRADSHLVACNTY